MSHSRVVGYNTFSVRKGSNLMCVPWATVGNAEGKADLHEVMDTSLLTSCDENFLDGDEIDTWTVGGGWDKQYIYCDHPEYEGYGDCWTYEGVPTDALVNPGAAFWFYAQKAIPNFALSGQVMNGTPYYALRQGSNLIAAPYAYELDFSDATQVVIANKTSCDENFLDGDEIDTWKVTGGFDKQYLYCDHPEYEGYGDCWTYEGVPVEHPTAAAGTGFWYYAKGSGTTLTFTAVE